MNCYTCRSDTVEHIFKDMCALMDGVPVVVRRVPTLGCRQCGAAVYESRVAERLDELRDSEPHSWVQAKVYDYARPLSPLTDGTAIKDSLA